MLPISSQCLFSTHPVTAIHQRRVSTWPWRVSQRALLRLPCGSSWREFWGATVSGLPPCPRSSVQPGRSSCRPVTSPESFSLLGVTTSLLRASALCQPFTGHSAQVLRDAHDTIPVGCREDAHDPHTSGVWTRLLTRPKQGPSNPALLHHPASHLVLVIP